MNTTESRATDHNRTGTKTSIRPGFGFLGVVLSFLLILPFESHAATPQFVPGQLLVKPKANLSEPEFSARLRTHGAKHRFTLRHLNVRVLNVPEQRVETVLAALQNDPGIEFAERDGVARAAFVPNDPYVVSGAEWHLSRIQAPSAWDLTTGTTNTVIAVLDSGVNFAHPDLAGQLLPGYNFVAGNSFPTDDFGHGTAVSGVVVAAGNNGLGVAGVAYGCEVLPVKVMDASGFATYSCLAEGIKYAVEQGARVINISIAGSSPSSTLQAAIDDAWSNNVVIVAAAGNNASSAPQYPAACNHVLGVSATEPDDSLAPFSSYGTFVTLSAPGDNIWTTQNDLSNPYGAWRGTSFASPMVAAVAALALAANPSLSNAQLISLLEQTADDLGPTGYDPYFGWGRVNAFNAVNTANPSTATTNQPPTAPPAISLSSPTEGAQFVIDSTIPLAAVASASTGSLAGVVFQIDGSDLATAVSAPFTADWTPTKPGTYSVTAIATDSSGLSTTSAPVTLVVSGSETIAPTIRLTRSPPNGARLQTSVVSLSGLADDNFGLARVEATLNGGPAQVADGTTNWSIQLQLVPGPNLVQLRSLDLAGNTSTQLSRTFDYVVTASLSLQTNGSGRISPNLDGRQLEIGRIYTVRAVPGPNQIFAGWEGIPAQGMLLSFLMQSNLVLVADFVPTPFPVVQGAYAGLVANTNTVTPDNSGFFTLAITSMGRFSGRLSNAGRSYGFHGQFDLGGNAAITVARGRSSPLSLALHVELTNANDQVTGLVSDGAWASELTGDRNVFNARLNPAQQAGQRSFVLEPANNPATTAATGSSQISPSGSAHVRGRLNDGRAFGAGSLLARNGDLPFYLSLNRGNEVVIGWLNFPAGPAPLAGGTVVWVKSGTNAFATTLMATAAQ